MNTYSVQMIETRILTYTVQAETEKQAKEAAFTAWNSGQEPEDSGYGSEDVEIADVTIEEETNEQG